MWLSRFVVGVFAAGLIVLGENTSGQDPSTGLRTGYPNKPIRIVTGGGGGTGDLAARLLAQGISGPLGQPVIVENRPSGVVTVQTVVQAQPDGHTLLLSSPVLWLGPLMQKMPYDPVGDFSPVSLVTRAPAVLVVHPSVPAKSVKDLIALAKAKPGALNFTSGGTGSSSHLAGELFKAMAGVSIVRVPYSSGSAEYSDLVGGQVQMTFGGVVSVSPHVKSGKLLALAVTTAQPSALLSGLPTIAASGLPGFEAVSIQGVLAPAKTPAAVINVLNQVMVRVLNQADVKETLLNTGLEPVGSSPEQFAATIKSEITKWGKVIKDAGIRID